MDTMPQLCLKWNNFSSTVSSSLESLRSGGDLVDTTLWCEGRQFKAHRVVLSVCSNYFRQIFREVSSANVAIVLSNVPHQDVESILSFMYSGEVSIFETQLGSFLKTAESLQVKGLRPEQNPPPSPTLSCSSQASRSGKMPETQFLAAALQRPKPLTPALLQNSASAAVPMPAPIFPAASALSMATLPSIDLGRAISNFAQHDTEASLSRKRKLDLGGSHNSNDQEMESELREHKAHNLVLVDMPGPAQVGEDSNLDGSQTQDPLRDQGDSPCPPTIPSRPHSAQSRGTSGFLAYENGYKLTIHYLINKTRLDYQSSSTVLLNSSIYIWRL